MLFFIFLPFLNFLILALFGRFIGKIGVIYITLYNILLLISANFFFFYLVLILDINFFFNFGIWIEFEWLLIPWEFIVDSLSVTIVIIVSLISSIVHIYSYSYIKLEPHFIRFISYLSLFTFFIFILVSAANFILLFIGWEGVGLCSFCLINFWSIRLQANKAAIKAILINRIGDIGFLLAFILIFTNIGTVDFGILQLLTPVIFFINDFNLDIICIFLLIGIVGKSAQIGLHTWLPAAIEGPTPVSALIHAATIVTAGIFLLIRICFLFELSTLVQIFIIILGALTAILSAGTAIFVYDLKRIIAYSTCSQLGYIILAAGLSQYNLSIFHLINHAFFKALLFLSAGAVIHSFASEQDIRKLSNLFFKIPFLYSSFLIGNIAILGIPFLAGFYSKDLIIELSYLSATNLINNKILSLNFLFIFISFATCFTSVYSFRIFYFLFLRTSTSSISYLLVLSQPSFIRLSLILLCFGSIFSGYLLSEVFIITNSVFYTTTEISNSFNLSFFFENELFFWYIKLAPFILNISVIFLGLFFTYFYLESRPILIWLSFYQYILKMRKSGSNLKIIKLIQNNFYFNEVYNYYACIEYDYYYINIFKNIDKGILEYLGPKKFSAVYFYLTTILALSFRDRIVTHFFLIGNSLTILFIWLDNYI